MDEFDEFRKKPTTQDEFAEFRPKRIPRDPGIQGGVDPREGMSAADKFDVGAGAAIDRVVRGIKGVGQAIIAPTPAARDAALSKSDEGAELYQKYHPGGMATAGEIGADVAMSLVPMGGAMKLANVLRAGPALALGADVLANAGYSAATTPENRGEAAVYGGAGAAIGRAVPPLVAALRGAKLGPKAKVLVDSGIQPTYGQVMGERVGLIGPMIRNIEETMEAVPIAGTIMRGNKAKARDAFQKATRDAAAPTGSAPTKTVDQISKQYTDLYEKSLAEVTAPVQPVSVDDLLGNSGVHGATEKMYDRAYGLLEDVIPSGPVSAKEAQQIESRLKKRAYNYKSSQDPFQREYGELLQGIASEYGNSWRSQIAKSTPDVFKAIQELDKKFAQFVPVRRAAGKGDLVDPSDYTPKHLLTSIRAGDKSLDKGRYLKGGLPQQELAQAAEDLLGSKSLEPGLRATLGTMGSIAGAATMTWPTLLGLSGATLYSLPAMQRILTGQNIGQKAFSSWYDALPAEGRYRFLEAVKTASSQTGRATATQE